MSVTRVAAWMLTLLPLLFGLVRLATTGYRDARYLTIALVAMSAAGAIFRLVRRPRPTRGGIFAVWLVALVATTAVLIAWAQLFGTGSGAGMWLVAFAFSLCEASGMALHVSASQSARAVAR